MKAKAEAMVMASLAADSLALGVHWIYNTDEIDRKFGRVVKLQKPPQNSYHPTKDLGDFTQYGDQTIVLLESVASLSGFSLERFAQSWQQFFKSYKGYVDHATKETLENFTAGNSPAESGSLSADLGGAARIAPLAYLYQDNLEKLVASAKAQTVMTHNNPQVVESADYLARITWNVLKGSHPTAAIQKISDNEINKDPLREWVATGMDSVRLDTREAIMGFGQMCNAQAALPSVIHLIVKYENNLQEALVENVMAGGDSAARGMVVGMILGAHLGQQAIPQKWLTGMKQYKKIINLLKAINAG
jgi:ADP-ribosylglycohydrolase